MVRPELVDKMVSGISLSVRSGEHEPARAGVTMISFLQAHGTFNERGGRSSGWGSWGGATGLHSPRCDYNCTSDVDRKIFVAKVPLHVRQKRKGGRRD